MSRADEALEFLRSVPEVLEEKWTMEQFDRVWAELKVYVREGRPSGQPKVPISRDYKGTQLCRKGTSQIPKFFWEVALQRFNAISAIKEETVTVECAQAAFDRLAGFSDPKKLVALAIDLSCILPGSCCLEIDVSERINGKCWDCFVRSPVAPEDERYECQVCSIAISYASDKKLESKCWSCFLKHPENGSVPVPTLPCKNLTAAHIACPKPRDTDNGGLYCKECRTTIEPDKKRYCRNAASKHLIKGSDGELGGCPELGQSNKHGFCKSCVGQAALLLCLNATNPRVRCGHALDAGSDRNEQFCKTCVSSLEVSGKKERLCKNAAASDDPCSNDRNVFLQNEYFGMCSSCGDTQKSLLVNTSEDQSLCRFPGCMRPYDLPLSRYCRKCISKDDLVIDVEEKHLVLEIETAAARKTTLQKVSAAGDPFHLYLPRRHTDLSAY